MHATVILADTDVQQCEFGEDSHLQLKAHQQIQMTYQSLSSSGATPAAPELLQPQTDSLWPETESNLVPAELDLCQCNRC